MKIKTKRQGEISENNYLVVYIGESRYRITESIDGKLCINKTSDGDSDLVQIHPRSGNEIELS
jgi:hypothetical protein